MIQEFIKYQKQVRGLSLGTCWEYQKNLRYFTEWARPRGLRWSTIWKSDIDCWTMEMKTSGLQAATIKQRISTLRTFFDWLVHEGKLEMNPARYCQTPKLAEKLPKEADLSLVDEFLSQQALTAKAKAVHMLTAIIVETGCRLNEAIAIKKSDFRNGGIIIKGKGSRERMVFYGQRTINAIRAYAPAGNELFAGWTDTAIRYTMYETLGRLCPRVHPHQLRHTFAMESLNAGLAINELSQLLGHKSITTTQIYARAATKTLENHYHQIHK